MAVEMFGWLDNLIRGKGSQQHLYSPTKPPKPLLHRWLGCSHCDNEATRRFCEKCYNKLLILCRAELPNCVGDGKVCSDLCARRIVKLVIAAMHPNADAEEDSPNGNDGSI